MCVSATLHSRVEFVVIWQSERDGNSVKQSQRFISL